MTPREIDRLIAEAVEPEPTERHHDSSPHMRPGLSPGGAWASVFYGWSPRHFHRDIESTEFAAKALALKHGWWIHTYRYPRVDDEMRYKVSICGAGIHIESLDPADALARALAAAIEGMGES